ncbi:polyamine-transporting ATPase anne boleyn isoform X2 [Nomia melanderi]|uniref:polyamine-transporting ATPase anne boleyn isoform X2 n=1 Tax=Nomia melanderi TaxID=2448451 RepID=UPI001303F7B5|nr:probable cation-transporting ATPase 13A3 isoform X2 [Nomia melanderi]XP_031832820.1 probable cation-transporting ATPase 13A3 isoform X2 [Nomia melanderi]
MHEATATETKTPRWIKMSLEEESSEPEIDMNGARGTGILHLKNGVDYVNPGEEDQMEIYGYKRNKLLTFIIWFLIFVTGGILRLVFHWVPQWMLQSTHSRCRLEDADTVLLVEKFQGKHTSYYVKKLKTLAAEDVLNNPFDGESLMNNEPWMENDNMITVKEVKEEYPSLSLHLAGGQFKKIQSIVLFHCKKLTYVWDPERAEFLKLRGLDVDVFTSTLHQMQGLNCHEQHMRRCVYGSNKITIPVKSIVTLVGLEVLNPFYVFQLLSFCLWVADNYYYYAMAILSMSSVGILMAAFQNRRNQQNLMSTIHSSDVATVMRDRATGQTATIPAERLVPGDILVIPSHGCLMPCDAVLLTGNCILNESMLTGESVPVTKTPIPSSNDITYDIKEHARHTLFCGTKVIQTRYYGSEKVLAVVVRTGFNTSKGALVRSIMYPPPVDFKFEQDSYKFVILLTGIASIGVVYTVVTKVMRGVQTSHIVLEALDLITVVVPPALPAAMTVGRLVAQRRLENNKIYCTSPRTINVSGSIDCICFDKTGTLTEDGLDMWGVVPAVDKKFQLPTKDIMALPLNDLLIGMVTCHGITIIDNQPVGDPLDLKMFESTGWTLEEPDVSDTSKFSMLFPTVVRPPKGSKLLKKLPNDLRMTLSRQNSMSSDVMDNISLNNLETTLAGSTAELGEQGLEIGIVRQFPFTSTLQRMSVITRTLGANHYDLYCKGSPEMILSLSKAESIPADFSAILQEYTSEGYRVIALAHKSLNRLPYAKVQRLSRESAESDLTFLAFVVMENRLKPESTPVINALNAACIKTVMVTGDNMLTALSVARDCEIVRPGVPVIAVSATQQNQTKPQIYFTNSNSQPTPVSPKGNSNFSEMTDLNSVASLETVESGFNDVNYLSDDLHRSKNKYVFALTGKTWALVKQYYPELIPKLATRGAIFARMSPDQKQQLVQELQSLGYYVAMVGDGANDCGALKAAHTGISLSDTESSVASPFTSREINISSVLTVIREGRAALVTSFGIFKYMASYSLTQFISVMLLYSIESNLTDIEFLYIDLFIISIFAFFFGRTQAYDGPLVKTTPLNSLISTTPILSLVTQILIVAIFQCGSLWHLQQMDWFKPFNATAKSLEDKDDVGCTENYTLFIISSMQYIILAVAFSKGHPYRKSLFTNYGLLTAFIFLSLFSVYLATFPFDWLVDWFELVVPQSVSFRFILIGYGAANFVISLLTEYFFVDYLVFNKLRYRWHNIDKSRRKFLAIERDLARDPEWPPISQEPLPEAAPDILIRQNVTEIKIEKRVPEPHSVDTSFMNSPVCANFKHFGSAREVTLNPRSLFNDRRNTVSMQTVPCFEDRDPAGSVKQPNVKLTGKRRHNSECENAINHYEKPFKSHSTNPIATLPRNPATVLQPQKLRDFKNVLVHKSEDLLSPSTQSVLELDILPS